MAESRRILAKSFGLVQKHGDFAYCQPGLKGVEFWHFGGLSLAICQKHGEFAVFCRVLGRALYARILAESFSARSSLLQCLAQELKHRLGGRIVGQAEVGVDLAVGMGHS